MKKVYVKIEGIHCDHCRDKIRKELLKNKNIKIVDIDKDIAYVSYNGKLENKDIIKIISNIDYFTKEEYISDDLNTLDTNIKLKEFIIILFCIILIAIIINKVFHTNIFNVIPTIDSSITYGMLIIVGMLTSIHCVSMCGAINLIAVVDNRDKRNFKKPILYNIGRVISYTIIGGIAGFLGSIFSISDTATGIMILLASILMFVMALNMLGIIKLKSLKFIKLNHTKNRNSFLIGLLNGFMPCGPLQAMQLYALGTSSFIRGALAMFLFGIGTVPLMLSVGIVLNLVKGKRKILINKIASVLILILSLVMLNRGLLALNINLFKNFSHYDSYVVSILKDDYQEIKFNLSYNNYQDIIVQKNIPVKMIIYVDKKYLTECNKEIVMKDFGIKQELEVGYNVVNFTPTETGTFTYTCWMNMITNNIKVIDDKNYFEEVYNE